MEHKYGECPICKEKNYLHFALGQYKGNIWCNWICDACYKEFRDKQK